MPHIFDYKAAKSNAIFDFIQPSVWKLDKVSQVVTRCDTATLGIQISTPGSYIDPNLLKLSWNCQLQWSHR